MREPHPGKIGRQVQARDFRVLQPEDADLVRMSAHGDRFDDVWRECALPGFMLAVRAIIDGVGREYGNAVLLEPAVGVTHGLPVKVELMVPKHKGVVADHLQADRHGRRIGGLPRAVLVELRLGDLRPLEQIAVVDHDGVLAAEFLPMLLHRRQDAQHVVFLRAVSQDVRLPALAVHIRRRQNRDIRKARLILLMFIE